MSGPRIASLVLTSTLAAVSGTVVVRPALAGPPVPASAQKSPLSPEEQAFAFADRLDDTLAKTIGAVEESTVAIWNRQVPKGAPAGTPSERNAGGSGVWVKWKDKGPFVITNEHVVREADALEVVAYGGEVYPAVLRDHVPQYDIAILELPKTKPAKWVPARFGRSESLVEGQWVVATGNPFFLGADGRPVATLGVISGLERTIRAEFTYAGAIQHDAEVNRGNSGGPLWNLDGELVGINGMISSRADSSSILPSNTGASFSIPIHLILTYFDDLLSDKKTVTAGWLGLEVEDARDPGGRLVGARVRDVRPESPARKKPNDKSGGLERGDVVAKLVLGGGVTPKSVDVFCATDFVNALAGFRAGERVKIGFDRNGKRQYWVGSFAAAPGSR